MKQTQVLGWRDVPYDNSMIGDTAKGTEPHIVQVFVDNSTGRPNWDFERELYRVRKVCLRSPLPPAPPCVSCSACVGVSARVVCANVPARGAHY